MPLAAGTRLGNYEIVASLGAGGMGEVHRALDMRLCRDVALKVLPDDVASSPERLARFERDGRIVASLNHPNIVTLYSIEEANGTRFLFWAMAIIHRTLGNGTDSEAALQRLIDEHADGWAVQDGTLGLTDCRWHDPLALPDEWSGSCP